MAQGGGRNRRRATPRTSAAKGSRAERGAAPSDIDAEEAARRAAREARKRERAEEQEQNSKARAEAEAQIEAKARRAPTPRGDTGRSPAQPAAAKAPKAPAAAKAPKPTRRPSGRVAKRRPSPRGSSGARPAPRAGARTARPRPATVEGPKGGGPRAARVAAPGMDRPSAPSAPDAPAPVESPSSAPGTARAPKRRNRRVRIAGVVVLAVACAVCVGLLVSAVVGALNAPPRAVPDEEPGLTVYDVDAEDPESQPPLTVGEASVSLSAVGDNLMHVPVVNTADAAEGELYDDLYDFGTLYQGVKEIVDSHDINFIDIETPMGGDELGVSGYPSFNTPSDDAADIASFGFNLATTATNHSWDQGFEGIQSMMGTWAEHPEVVVAGTYTSAEDRGTVRTFTKNGLTFAFLAYQDYLNGYELPSDKTWAVGDSNDTEAVRADLERAHELAECVIVAMSWGTEYSNEPNESQRETAQLFADEGVDLVLGFGPHVIQPVEWVQGRDAEGQPTGHRTMVVYSLGNFVSNQQNDFNQVEGCFTCDIVRDEQGTVGIAEPTWIPLVNHFSGGTGHRVYQLKDYTADLARSHDILAGKENPLGYVRDYTTQIIDPSVVDIQFGDVQAVQEEPTG